MRPTFAVTGASGFLGWHVRVLARALGWPQPVLVDRAELADPRLLASALSGTDRVLHLAGINRGDPEAIVAGNTGLARSLAEGLRRCAAPPATVVFANSIQAGNGTPYGDAKATAAAILADATGATGSTLVDQHLPNLFGEHGRPHYNSVLATFCRVLADGGTPQIHADRKLDLMHATDAAGALLGTQVPGNARWGEAAADPVRRMTVVELAQRLAGFAELYRDGDIPDLSDRFDVRLFNTYRSHCFPGHYPLRAVRRTDQRGELVEAVRVHGGGGQTFWSSTAPGATRGEHFHLEKVERFAVLRGEAVIGLRRLFDDEIVRFRVSGGDPVAVDMPTMWVHNITNVGHGELLTAFWSHEILDPACPDTYPEPVATTAPATAPATASVTAGGPA